MRAAVAAALLFVLGPVWGGAPPDPPVETGLLLVKVDGISRQEGAVRLALFNSAEGFPGRPEKAFRRLSLPVQGETATARFEDIPFGSYALSAHHDWNDDKKLNKNPLGIPREPIAVSNNPRIRFGPPSFEKARFDFRAEGPPLLLHLPRSSSPKEEPPR